VAFSSSTSYCCAVMEINKVENMGVDVAFWVVTVVNNFTFEGNHKT
jgi:hypothetical protein